MLISKRAIEIEMARKQISLTDISVKTGISIKTLSNAVHRQRTMPVTLGKIAAALGVDPELLLRKEA